MVKSNKQAALIAAGSEATLVVLWSHAVLNIWCQQEECVCVCVFLCVVVCPLLSLLLKSLFLKSYTIGLKDSKQIFSSLLLCSPPPHTK